MKIWRLTIQLGAAVVIGCFLAIPFQLLAAAASTNYTYPTTKDVIITEIQTASTVSGGEEFVEFYNNTDADIDLADTAHSGKDSWKLQYFSGSKVASLLSATDWTGATRTVVLTGTVPAHEYYVLAGGSYQPGNIVPDQGYAATLADESGALQLVDSATISTVTTTTVHDRLAWSSDKTLPAMPVLYAAPGAGASLQRVPNADSEYVNQDGTLTSFITDSRISPANAWTAPVVADVPSEDTTSDSDSTDPSGDDPETAPTPVVTVLANQGLPVPIVAELLPNPASPQTDENDEYIELYNPGDTTFNLKGYSLETGTATLHDFTFTEDTLLDPHSFRAFFSSDTGLSLSNSGGQARLLDTNGTLLSQSSIYSAASDGQAWALDETDGEWHWTTVPTPSADNIIHAPIVLAKATVVNATKKTTAAKTGKVKGISTVKKAKSTRSAKAKKPAKKSTATALTASTTTPAPVPIHSGVLAAVAVLAVGYGVYEYRHDLGNRFHQLRTNRAARRTARK